MDRTVRSCSCTESSRAGEPPAQSLPATLRDRDRPSRRIANPCPSGAAAGKGESQPLKNDAVEARV